MVLQADKRTASRIHVECPATLQPEQQVEKSRMLSSRSLTTSSLEYKQERCTSS